jgi:DNA repair protein RadC
MNETCLDLLSISEIQLSYKSKVKASLRPKISGSQEAYDILVTTWDASKIEFIEQFKVLLLNRASKVIGMFEVSSGSSTGTIVDPKLIFASAIKANACGIILAHNHPSGNLMPSKSDIQTTNKIKSAGKFLEIDVLDHLIITNEGYYSFADAGVL